MVKEQNTREGYGINSQRLVTTTWESRDAHQRGGIRVHVKMRVSVRRNLEAQNIINAIKSSIQKDSNQQDT